MAEEDVTTDDTVDEEVKPKKKTTKKSTTKKTTAEKKAPPKSAVKKKQVREDVEADASDVIGGAIEDSHVTVSPASLVDIDKDQVLLQMVSGVAYATGEGVRFTQEHPFQLVSNTEALTLVQQERFAPATPEQVRDFYEK